MKKQSRKERLEALKRRLSNKYGLAGAVLGSFIIFVGVFLIPFSAIACINCAIPLVAALGLGGTVAGLAGKNVYIIGAGIVLLAGSGYLLVFRGPSCTKCAAKKVGK